MILRNLHLLYQGDNNKEFVLQEHWLLSLQLFLWRTYLRIRLIATTKVENLIAQLKKNYTIVIVTHNMQQASRISDNTAFFYMGDLIEFDSTNNIFTNPKEENRKLYNSKVWIKIKIWIQLKKKYKSLENHYYKCFSCWVSMGKVQTRFRIWSRHRWRNFIRKRINAQELKIDSECENLIVYTLQLQ